MAEAKAAQLPLLQSSQTAEELEVSLLAPKARQQEKKLAVGAVESKSGETEVAAIPANEPT